MAKERKINMNKKLYLAYGSNLNLAQMAGRCPTAKLVAESQLKDYKLLFRGPTGAAVATVEPSKGDSVPVLIWEITKSDEAALDRYEGFPFLYRKENFTVKIKGRNRKAMAYIMNEGRALGQPSIYYYSVIHDGYRAHNFNDEVLKIALEDSIERIKVAKDAGED
jgi:gamma-glutamylcyclotransferase (GGCT)/AIG2-like uncharacterized protein YtfP